MPLRIAVERNINVSEGMSDVQLRDLVERSVKDDNAFGLQI